MTIDGAAQTIWHRDGWSGFSRMGQTFIVHLILLLLLVLTLLGGAVGVATSVFHGTASTVFFVLLAVASGLTFLGLIVLLLAWGGAFQRVISTSATIDPDELHPRALMFSLTLFVLDAGLLLASILVAIVNAIVTG